jgi:leucyl-tRNA synthetase
VTLAVQVNGKRRGEVTVPKDATKDAVLAAAKAAPNIAKYVDGAHIVREIVVPGRLVNIVVKG